MPPELREASSLPVRCADRWLVAGLPQPPPRIDRPSPDDGPGGSTAGRREYRALWSDTHSQTLPCISYRPQGLGRLLPTGCTLRFAFSMNQAGFPAMFPLEPFSRDLGRGSDPVPEAELAQLGLVLVIVVVCLAGRVVGQADGKRFA